MTGQGVGPGTVLPQQGGHRGGEGHDPGMLAKSGDMVKAGEQVGPFSPCPRQRLIGPARAGSAARRCSQGRGGASAGAVRQSGLSEGGGVLIVVQQPIECLLAIENGVSVGAAADVAADQVVHVVPVVARLGQEAHAMQDVQVPVSLPQAGAGQGGGGVPVNGGARMQAEALEEPPVVQVQVPVGHLERGGHAVFFRRQGEHARRGLGG